MRAAPRQLVAQASHRVDEVLAVIDHDERALRCELFRHALEQRHADALMHAEHAGQRAGDAFCTLQRREVDEPNAIGEGLHVLLRELQRQARLAAAADAGQREQARVAQQLRALRQLARAADEVRARLRQVVRHAVVWCGSLRRVLDARDELVAPAGDGRDHALTEHLAQRAHLHLQVAFLDDQTGPDQIEQLVLVTVRSRRSISAMSTSKARAPSLTGVAPCSTARSRGRSSKPENPKAGTVAVDV